MTRATEAFTTAAIVIGIYLVFALHIIPLPQKIQDDIIPVLPWWVLVSFGSYCLGTLGWNVMTFGECPEAYDELMREISEAKNDLRSKGMTIN
ncbi:dolichol-phosphate mannosyltransferase subunit 3 [Umbelopsis sp. PMI_123]|nr:dolichol-phosphate mannosyltransferase subunit 3 [Umbelopsis sp. PMI_123]